MELASCIKARSGTAGFQLDAGTWGPGPDLVLVAAVAVAFECTPFLRGGLGNVIYFFLFMAVLTVWLASTDGVITKEVNDPFGIAHVIADMQRAVQVHNPAYAGEVAIGGAALSADPLIFRWEGLVWTATMVWQRLSWVGIAGLIALAAAWPFDRFDPARSGRRRRAAVGNEAWAEAGTDVEGEPVAARGTAEVKGHESAAIASLTPLPARHFRSRFGQVLLADLRLMVRGRRLWWYAVFVGLIAAVLTVPDVTVRRYLQAATWLMPLLIWSSMGVRERQHSTGQIVFSVAHPLGRQLVATWLAGVCVSLLAGSGFALRSLFTGQWGALDGWAAGVLFIPSLALALGTWSGSSRALRWSIRFCGTSAP